MRNDRRLRGYARAAVCCGVLVLAAAGGEALAATTVGSSLTGDSQGSDGCGEAGVGCTFMQSSLPGRRVSTPAGVISSWGVARTSGAVTFVVLRGDGSGGFAVVARSGPQSPSGGGAQSFNTRIGVRSGDRIGLEISPGGQYGFRYEQGAVLASWRPPLGGDFAAPTGTQLPDTELLLRAVVEPDADGDGYGDDTQDGCPTSAATHGPCPSPPSRGGGSCGEISFTPGASLASSHYGVGSIKASRTSCTTARKVAKAAGNGSHNRYHAYGFSCAGRTRADRSVGWRCTKKRAVVTFRSYGL